MAATNTARLAGLVILVVLVTRAGCAHTPRAEAGSAVELLTYDAEIAGQSLTAVFLRMPWELTGAEAKVDAIAWTLEITDEAAREGTVTPAAPTSGDLMIEGMLATTDEAFAAREGKDALLWNAAAVFTVSTPEVTEAYEATWHGEIYPPKRPSVAVDPHAARYGSTHEFTFTLVVTNPNPFPIASDGLAYEIEIDGSEVAAGIVAQGLTLDHGTETQYEVEQQVGGGELDDLAKRIGGRKTIPYQVETKLAAGGLTLANTLTGEIEFAR